MRSSLVRALFFALVLWVIFSAPLFAAEFTVLWPPDYFLVAAPSVRLIVEITGNKTDALRLR